MNPPTEQERQNPLHDLTGAHNMTPLDPTPEDYARSCERMAARHDRLALALEIDAQMSREFAAQLKAQAADLRSGKATMNSAPHVEPDWHNPENLPSPGGPEWRFLVKSERTIPEDAEFFSTDEGNEWAPSVYRGQSRDECRNTSYRTRQPLPTP